MLKAFTRSWMDDQEPRSAMGVRKVVRSTSHRLIPSRPTW